MNWLQTVCAIIGGLLIAWSLLSAFFAFRAKSREEFNELSRLMLVYSLAGAVFLYFSGFWAMV